ncbi:aromatic/alkene monooxygenase hydroxylase subunit beta [uncultured Thiothrix sp.]|uniref:aromatic/alkene monooxygenase hydroxylase subunit beta n=1 Tax=uncultured Thiothrix sp. TaxID=223185 RepID=UPI00261F0AE4|nr:aromatic/alkene monooxygenase hydroxylase subunit beta [uncultured Thiothrix sp.]
MSLNISAKEIKPLRQNFGHIARRIGDNKPATRYQEAVYDVQPTTNFHYPPSWDPSRKIYDTARTAIVMQDWYSFTDPRQYYYTSYVAARAKQQEIMESNFELVEKHNLLQSLSAELADQIRQVLIPLRHYEYGANMNNQDICHRGYGTTITSVASYNGFDRIGMAQYVSRIALLLDGNEETSLNAAKVAWLEHPAWQGLRHAMEDSFVLDDWFEILMVQDVIMDGLLFPLIYERFISQVAAQGGSTFLMLTQFMNEWNEENTRWTNQLLKVTANESAENAALLAQWTQVWLARVDTALAPIAHLAFGDQGAEQLAAVKTELVARLAKQGVKV